MVAQTDPDYWAQAQAALVADLRAKGITDERVLSALAHVPRQRFVGDAQRHLAYVDNALSIGHGQTISQPYMVAAMSAALELNGSERVLEVGTGSGYQSAVLARLTAHVDTVERLPQLAKKARQTLTALAINNVVVHEGDGTLGWPDAAPFDAIIVTAGGPSVPEPLLAQLAEGGRLVIPTGDRRLQTLMCYRKQGGKVHGEAGLRCMFVPLIGHHGWQG